MAEYTFTRNQRAGQYDIADEWDVPDNPVATVLAAIPGLTENACCIGAEVVVVTNRVLTPLEEAALTQAIDAIRRA